MMVYFDDHALQKLQAFHTSNVTWIWIKQEVSKHILLQTIV